MSEEKTIKVIEEAEKELSNLIELSTGVVLTGMKANPVMMIRVMAGHKRPKVPTWNDPKMGREMENHDDPDYQKALKDHEMEQSNAVLTAFILMGTDLVEKLPKGMEGPHPIEKKHKIGVDEDKNPIYQTLTIWPEWMDEYSLLDLPMERNNEKWRYLTWVMFKAVADEKDLVRIQEVVGRLSGLSETSVQAAEEFPGSD